MLNQKLFHVFKIQIGDTLDKDINWAVEHSLWVKNDKKVKTVKKKKVKSKDWKVKGVKSKSGNGVSGKYGRYTGGGGLKGELHQIPARNRK